MPYQKNNEIKIAVNSKIFLKVCFRESDRSLEIKPSRSVEILLSFTDVDESIPISSQICLLTLFEIIKILAKLFSAFTVQCVLALIKQSFELLTFYSIGCKLD